MYKDMLELKAVLDSFREKMSNIPSAKRLVERKHKLGKKDIYMEKNQELDQLLKKIQEDNFLSGQKPLLSAGGISPSQPQTQASLYQPRASTTPQPVRGMMMTT